MAVIYDFQSGRSGEACREFLADWRGHLVCDDYGGYKAGFATGITEVGCWAHARRKFFELTERNDGPIAKKAQAYLRDVLERMPTAQQSDLDGLLPHNWQAPVKV